MLQSRRDSFLPLVGFVSHVISVALGPFVLVGCWGSGSHCHRADVVTALSHPAGTAQSHVRHMSLSVIIHTSSSFIVTREENAAHLLHPLRLEPHSIHPRKSWSRSISWTHSSLPKTRGALSGLGTFLCCQQSERKEAASPSIPSLTWCMAVFRNNLAQSISHRLWRELLH